MSTTPCSDGYCPVSHDRWVGSVQGDGFDFPDGYWRAFYDYEAGTVTLEAAVPEPATMALLAGVWAMTASKHFVRWLALGLALLVGVSRMAVGVHWPSDVLAGAVTGFALPLLLSQLPGCRQAA